MPEGLACRLDADFGDRDNKFHDLQNFQNITFQQETLLVFI